LVHRDIKPANLLVDQQRTVKVLDLGLASVKGDIDGAITKEFDDKVLGTVDYLAPEQAIDSHQVDGRADTYSLGCTLYFLLSGRPPFTDSSLAQRIMAHQVREPVDLREARPEVPTTLVQICRRMMAKSASARYQCMEEVSEALANWLAQPAPAEVSVARSNDNLRLAPLEEDLSATTSADRPQPARHPVQLHAPQSHSQRGEEPSSSPDSKAPESKAPSRGLRQKSGAPAMAPRTAAIKPVQLLRFDELLAELPPCEQQSGAPSGPTLGPTSGKPIGQRRPAARNRWDSPWFVIGTGALLGLLVVLAWFGYHFLAGSY
jgi:serine/threonine-protein kinase